MDMNAKATGAASGRAASCDPPALLERFDEVRTQTSRLCEPLRLEDFVVQSMPDASPAKWHAAHTTWFFETFLLESRLDGYQRFHEDFSFLFNSYYDAVGKRMPRPHRGLITRPGVEEVLAYRKHVDSAMRDLIDSAGNAALAELAPLIEIGLHHEQQHQELLLTDIKHLLSCNPLRPAYQGQIVRSATRRATLGWVHFDAGVREIGADGAGPGFCFDNEAPRHPVHVGAFALADRLLTNDEYLAFIEDGGYERSELWLDDGWSAVRERGWAAPLYWWRDGDQWREFTLSGEVPLDPQKPVCHLSFYEADAVARWSGARLPTEAEWEVACADQPIAGNFVEGGILHPVAAPAAAGVRQAFGDLWEWTRSAYEPYPGYRPPSGALGEYNGKFMCNQQVLRGGACVTPQSHMRATYRNFFHPDKRWQFTGVRLAKDG